MNLESHRGSDTSLTFITIILCLVFPLFDSVSGGVYTFFSFCHYLSFYSVQAWIEKVCWV